MRNKIELLSPAGSMEAVYAAVQSGADAIYLGGTMFNARRNAKNFSNAELAEVVKYCRRYGVQTHVTLNILLSDRELPEAAAYIKTLSDIGVDAVIVQDLGVAKLVREIAPELTMHASTQMSVHNLDGVLAAASLGFKRVVLARELSGKAIEAICKASPVEIEVFAHGALCMCYSGQCYMSGLIGQRSGNRGLCAQPCRMKYSFGDRQQEKPLLSLKDLNLVEKLEQMKAAGVASLKIEGRMKRPEYVALVTGVYRRAIDSGRAPSRQELADLELMFSRDGFTDGYYTGKTGATMFGARAELPDKDAKKLYAEVKRTYEKGDSRKVPITMEFRAIRGRKTMLTCYDELGNLTDSVTPEPQEAQKRATTREEIEKNLNRVGNTPFAVDNMHIALDDGLLVPLSVVNNMRRKCLDELLKKRERIPERKTQAPTYAAKTENTANAPVCTVSVLSMDQVSRQMLDLRPEILYIPLIEAAKEMQRVVEMQTSGQRIGLILPRVITPGQEEDLITMLTRFHLAGVEEALCGNLGHVILARNCGYRVHGDFGLNVFNSETYAQLEKFGLESLTASFEARFAQIKDLSKTIPTEAIVYGRLPLMVFENCVIKAAAGACVCDTPQVITDRTGQRFPIVREYPHRNQLLNAQKLWLADKTADFRSIGLWAQRLMFTTESARECVDVMQAYLQNGTYTPTEFTRGLYYRGVE